MARLTLNGMYEYDNSIFDGMILPEGYDRDALFFEIMQRSGQLYPYHQQPGILKSAIRLWFARNYLNFDRTMEALQAEYNPIENYDRYEDWTRTPNLTDEDTHAGTDSTAHSGYDDLVRSGFDTVANTGTDTTTHSGTDTTEHSGKDTTTHSGKDTTDHSGKDTTDHSGKDTTKHTGTDSTDHTYTNYKETMTMAGGHTTEEQVSAYDNASYQPSKKTIETFGDPSTRTDEKAITGSHADDLTHGHQEEFTHGHKEELTHGLKEELTHGHKEELEHGLTEELTHGHTEELEHGLTETTTRGTTDTSNYNSSESTTYGSTVTGRHTGTESYTAHLHGNIGVTTNQQMITSEIELRKYDVYVDIAGRFEHEFLVQIY